MRSGEAVKRLALDFDALAADVYWIRAIQHYGGDRLSTHAADAQLRAAVSAARPDDDARSVLQHRLSLRRDLPERSAIQVGPAGPIRRSRCCSKGIAAQPHEVAVLPRHRVRLLLAPARLQGGRELVPARRRQPGAPNWLRPLAAAMLDARQRSRVGALPVAADAAVGGGVAAPQRRARLLQLDALDRSISSKRVVKRFPPPPGERVLVGGADAAARRCAAFRSIRPARRSRSIRRPARSTCRQRSTSVPDARAGTAAIVNLDPARLTLAGRCSLGLAVGSFLNVCIHRLPRAGARSSSRLRAVPHCGYVLRWFDNIPVVSYAAARRPLPQCRAPISIRYPIVELVTMASSSCTTWSSAGHRPRAAAAVCLRDDRAVRHRSRASPPAERHHAARASSSGSCSACAAAGPRRRAHRRRRRRRRPVADRRGLLPLFRPGRAWAAATSRCWR